MDTDVTAPDRLAGRDTAPVSARAATADVFLSYSRRDREFARWLHRGLVEAGKEVYVDWEDIPDWSPDYESELEAAIRASDALVFVLSPDSVRSANCLHEMEVAAADEKRIRPVLCRPVADESVPTALRKPQWLDGSAQTDESVAKLVAALEVDPEWVRSHTRLVVRSREWEGSGRDASFLLRGSDLRAAEAWLDTLAGRDPPPTSLQTEFVLASERATVRRQRAVLGAVVAALVVAIALTAIAFVERSRAIHDSNVSRSRELATAATSQLLVDPERSLILAVDAVHTAKTAQAVDALRRSLATSRIRKTLKVGPLSAAALTPDGRRLVAVGWNFKASVWDLTRRKRLATVEGAIPQIPLTLSPDGRYVAGVKYVVGLPSAFRLGVWDARTGKELDRLNASGAELVAFSPDDAHVVTYLSDNAPSQVWDVRTRRRIAILRGAPDATHAEFSPDGRRVLTVSDNGLQVWSLEKHKALADIGSIKGKEIAYASFAGNSDHVTISDVAGTAYDWRIGATSAAAVPLRLRLPADSDTAATITARHGNYIAASQGEGATIWNAKTGTSVAVLRGGSALLQLGFGENGSTLITIAKDGAVRTWAFRERLPSIVQLDHPIHGQAGSATFSSDLAQVAMANNRGLRVWNVATGRATVADDYTSIDLTEAVVAFSSDGTRVITVADDGLARLRRLPHGRLIGTLSELTGDRADDAAFSPNDDRIVTGENTGMKVWDTATLRVMVGVRSRDQAEESATAFSPDGRLIAVGGNDGKARILDARTGLTRRVIPAGSWILHLAFSPDGSYLATTGIEEPVKVWRVSTGQNVAVFPSSTIDAESVAFDRSGQLVISVNRGGTASVWDIATGTAAATVRGPRRINMLGARITANGRILIAGADQKLRLYPCDVCGSLKDLLALARTRITRDLTPEEQQRYLHR